MSQGNKLMAVMPMIFLVSIAFPALAGDLTPPEAPGSTMHTLEEIYTIVQDTNSKVNGGASGDQALVPKSGQTTSYATGDDGDHQAGLAWPDPRFTDHGDGTVTDNLTGLIWLKDADCFGAQTWANALVAANTLNSGECGLSDDSIEGGWRLPQVRELHSLVDFGNYNPALPAGYPFSGVQPSSYWSATTNAYYPDGAWYVNLPGGSVNNYLKTNGYYVWPVRDGQ